MKIKDKSIINKCILCIVIAYNGVIISYKIKQQTKNRKKEKKMITEKELMVKFNEYTNKENHSTLEEIEQEQQDYNFNDSVLCDVSLESIVDGLIYNGFSIKELEQMLENQYGNIIEVYYLNADNMYCVLVGAR